jgi:hypothetical protein
MCGLEINKIDIIYEININKMDLKTMPIKLRITKEM